MSGTVEILHEGSAGLMAQALCALDTLDWDSDSPDGQSLTGIDGFMQQAEKLVSSSEMAGPSGIKAPQIS